MALVCGAEDGGAAVSYISSAEPDLLTAYEIPNGRVHKFNTYGRFKEDLEQDELISSLEWAQLNTESPGIQRPSWQYPGDR